MRDSPVQADRVLGLTDGPRPLRSESKRTGRADRSPGCIELPASDRCKSRGVKDAGWIAAYNPGSIDASGGVDCKTNHYHPKNVSGALWIDGRWSPACTEPRLASCSVHELLLRRHMDDDSILKEYTKRTEGLRGWSAHDTLRGQRPGALSCKKPDEGGDARALDLRRHMLEQCPLDADSPRHPAAGRRRSPTSATLRRAASRPRSPQRLA
jgi:hypothetical protein